LNWRTDALEWNVNGNFESSKIIEINQKQLIFSQFLDSVIKIRMFRLASEFMYGWCLSQFPAIYQFYWGSSKVGIEMNMIETAIQLISGQTTVLAHTWVSDNWSIS
jgi:hypothetical protein